MDRRKRSFISVSFFLSGLSFAFLLSGCSLVKVVPVQLARVSQMETYTQTFDINLPESSKSVLTSKRNLQIAELDSVLTDLLGKKNWQHLKDLYGSAYLIDAFLNKEIIMKGQLNSTIYLEPLKHEKVLFEGFGRFFVLMKNSGKILLSGDSQLVPEHHTISSFKNGKLKLKVLFYVTRIPQRSTNYHEAKVEYHIKINNKFKSKNVYALDYDAAHTMYMYRALNKIDKKMQKIGELKFDAVHAGSKLIDFNGMIVIKNDYSDMVREFEAYGQSN